METSTRSNFKAFYYCYFLGFLGIHRFYAGRTLSGIIQLLTLGGLLIWWTIDLYRITRGQFIDSEGKVLKWEQPATTDEHIFAGFWIRLTAYLIDWFIISIAAGVVAVVINSLLSISGHAAPNQEEMLNDIYDYTGYIIALIYSVYFYSSRYQATPGKIAVGIYIIDSNGGKLSAARAFLRFIGEFISALILCIGYIMIAFNDKKRGLHDYIAGTFVVYGKPGKIIKP